MLREYQRLALRSTKLEITEDKNDPLAFHWRVILDRIYMI